MVHFREPEVFERKMTQTIDGFVGSNCAFTNFLEKLADGFGVQVALSNQDSAFSRQWSRLALREIPYGR